MIIDCDSCEVRGTACGDCVISVLLGTPSCRSGLAPAEPVSGAPIVQLEAPERRAIEMLADQGLVPRLRLVATAPRRATPGVDADRVVRDTG